MPSDTLTNDQIFQFPKFTKVFEKIFYFSVKVVVIIATNQWNPAQSQIDQAVAKEVKKTII